MSFSLDELHHQPLLDLLSNDDAFERVLNDAPYLASLHNRFADVRTMCLEQGADAAFNGALALVDQAENEVNDREAIVSLLRQAKGRGHLAIALADLSGVWTCEQVTHAITRLADRTVQAAMWAAYCQAAKREWVEAKSSLCETGLFALAMGKMGAFELNYSSDVDLIMLFDPSRFAAAERSAKEAALRMTQDFVAIMETRDAEGYVFRTDLRLRPDPSSTPIAMSTEAALNYYERIGQNWERMAHIKARPCAGDMVAAKAYMDELEPFIWRRHLDYWAIGDIHAIKRQIHATGGHEAIGVAEFDVKLGRGGIREIEFFAQTQQLILGGRHSELRVTRTDEGLDALVKQTVVERKTAADLKIAYAYLRTLEHRIQMRNDEQTHILPDDVETRGRIARLMGYGDDLPAFEKDVLGVREFVHGAYSDLFAQEERLSGDMGNLVFTGVDDDPGTLKTLEEMGFSDPPKVIDMIRRWHRGGVPATRSARGRQLLTTLTPRLLTWMAETGEADAAIARFSDFISGLRGGVQVFALMLAEPAFAHDLIAVMAYAPKLANDLARQPALLDGMLDNSFNASLVDDSPHGAEASLRRAVDEADDFEGKLNAARRFHREEALRIGYQVLRGQVRAVEAGAAYTRLADACIRIMADAALEEVTQKFGEWPGRWVVGAFGKLGGEELSATSDLDIILIYDPGDPPHPNDLAARFTQRLIAALSSPTEEGHLYEVDMQLRPSGRAGPVAVKLSSFEKYYEKDAWTWEFMALTRLRCVAGDPALSRQVEQIAKDAIRRRSEFADLKVDILDMRRRLARDRAPKNEWDLKLTPGGLLDIEFVVQQEIILNASTHPEVVQANTVAAIEALEAIKAFTQEEADLLKESYRLQVDLQQALRIAISGDFDPVTASEGIKRWLSKIAACESFEVLTKRLLAAQSAAENLRVQKIGTLATENNAGDV